MITKVSGFHRFEQRLGINTGKLAGGREAGGGADVVSELRWAVCTEDSQHQS